METIATRIMQVVEENGGNMSEFARSIGVTPAYISKLKNKPDSTPSTDVVQKICEVYDVRENWLKTGEGPMKLPKIDADLEIINDLLSDTPSSAADLIRNIWRTYRQLSPEHQKVLDNFIATLLNQK